MFYGQHVQKNFRAASLAGICIHGLVAQGEQGEFSMIRLATTTLTKDEELREAELTWSRLRQANPKASLIAAVDYYLENAGIIVRNGQASIVLDES